MVINDKLDELYPILDLLDKQQVSKNSSIDLYAYLPNHWDTYVDVYIRTNYLPVDMAIDLIAGPIHRQFNIKWTMNVEQNATKLHGAYKGSDITIYICHSEIDSCILVEKVTKVLTEKELDQYRTEKKYFWDCS